MQRTRAQRRNHFLLLLGVGVLGLSVWLIVPTPPPAPSHELIHRGWSNSSLSLALHVRSKNGVLDYREYKVLLLMSGLPVLLSELLISRYVRSRFSSMKF